jgi:F-box and WD-40 domain protein 1/11
MNIGVAVPPLPIDSTGRGQRPFKKVFSSPATPEPSATSASLYHQGSILCLQYSDEILVTGSSDCTCIVWDIKAGYSPVRQLRHHTAGVLDVCFDTKHIVSCSKDTNICLWDQQTGDFLRKLSGHRGPVNAVQMRGTLVVSASGDGIAKLWNLASGLCIKEFPSKDRGMACVEFSPDSRTILAGGNDQVIYQFDTNTGELVRELNGHKGLVRSLHLDSANERVVSGSYDTSVKAYDLCTGDTIVDFMGWTTSWILSAKADYRRIIATSQDSRIVIMDFGFELPGVELLAG